MDRLNRAPSDTCSSDRYSQRDDGDDEEEFTFCCSRPGQPFSWVKKCIAVIGLT